jgi:hypothetical protein
MGDSREEALHRIREAIADLRALPRAEDQAQQLAELKQTHHLIDLLELDSAAQLKDVTAAVDRRGDERSLQGSAPGPVTVRCARPTSSGSESGPSRSRVKLQSQLKRLRLAGLHSRCALV